MSSIHGTPAHPLRRHHPPAPPGRRLPAVIHAALGLMLLFVAVSSAPAELTFCERDFNEFGKVPNTQDGICAAVAAVNSFVFLRNHFPGIYSHTDIIPDWNDDGTIDYDDHVSSRDKMAFGWTHNGHWRRGVYGSGATGGARDIWEATYYWVEDFSPGITVLDGQIHTYGSISGWPGGEVLEKTYPTWDFLWNELVAGRDVQIGMLPAYGGYGHAITLTGLGFDDLDGDGLWAPGEDPLQIGYLDPNDVGAQIWADVSFRFGRIEFEWWQNEQTYYIYRTYTEGPINIAEPSTIALLAGLFLLGAGRLVRRRRTPDCR